MADGQTVECVSGGDALLGHCRDAQPDLVVLTCTLPDGSGLGVCRALRQYSDVPIMLIGGVTTCIDALEVGADVYMEPPLSPREFVARVHALQRRAQRVGGHITVGDLQVYPRQFRATLCGTELALRPQEYRVLLLLAANPGTTFSRERLLQLAWQRHVTLGTLTVHMAWLRRKLRGSNVRIENAPGAGYRLVAAGVAAA